MSTKARVARRHEVMTMQTTDHGLARSGRGRMAFLVLASVFSLVSAVRGEDSIVLRTAARIETPRAVTLSDIADLSGAGAQKLGGVVILGSWPAKDQGWTSLDIEAVRKKLAGEAGVNWGKLALQGSTCTIRVRDASPTPPSVGASPVLAGASNTAGAPSAQHVLTVRDLLVPKLSGLYGVPECDVRVDLGKTPSEVLATPISGRTSEIVPTGKSDRTPIMVRVYEGDRLVASGAVRVGVEVRRMVLVAKGAMKRGEVVNDGAVTAESRWVGATSVVAETADLGGLVRARLAPGQVVLKGDLVPPVVVRKGDLVSVSCVAGTVALKTVGRSLDEGAVGDVIRLEYPDNKKRTFTARVAGPGRAVTTAVASEPVDAASEEPRMVPEVAPSVGVPEIAKIEETVR